MNIDEIKVGQAYAYESLTGRDVWIATQTYKTMPSVLIERIGACLHARRCDLHPLTDDEKRKCAALKAAWDALNEDK